MDFALKESDKIKKIAEKLGYGDRGTYLKIYSLLEEVSKMLNVMMTKLKGGR